MCDGEISLRSRRSPRYCGCRIVLSVLILLKSSESLGGWAERLPLCGRGLLVGEAGGEEGHRGGEAGFGR